MTTDYEQPRNHRTNAPFEQQFDTRGRQQYNPPSQQPFEQRGRPQYDQQYEHRNRQPSDQQNDPRARQQYDRQAYEQYDQQYEQRNRQPSDHQAYQQYEQQQQQQHPQRARPQGDPSPHQAYERGYPQDDNADPQQRPFVPERGRAIRLLRNGDPFFTGRTFIVNQRRYPLFDVFLDDVSQALRANFGAVRSIYTPRHGTRLKDITDLEDHRTYVAGGGERFKKLHYLDIVEGKRVATKGPPLPKYQLPPVRRVDAEGRAMKLSRSENMIIYVYRNGDQLTLPAKILLVKAILQSWEPILDEVTQKVSLPNTAVLKLYTMNGDLVTSPQQLEYGGMYVAAGKERFRRVEYPDPKSYSANSSPKMSRKSVRPQQRLPPIQRRTDDHSADQEHRAISSEMQQRYIKNDGIYTQTTTTTATSRGSNEPAAQRRPVREEYDFFNNKPQQHRRGPAKETDLDRDEGGIYKGRTNHRDRVREIDDNRDTKVEVPVEHRRIETIEDEDVYGDPKANRRRQPPLSTQSFSDTRQKPARDHAPVDRHATQRESRPPQAPSKPQANRFDEEQAATVIQSHLRGYLTRKRTQKSLQQQQQQQTKSDSRNDYPYHRSPQRNERGYDRRDDYA